jgi:membrane-bound metal-dependent hydrolase YbcI (DUF457 family)
VTRSSAASHRLLRKISRKRPSAARYRATGFLFRCFVAFLSHIYVRLVCLLSFVCFRPFHHTISRHQSLRIPSSTVDVEARTSLLVVVSLVASMPCFQSNQRHHSTRRLKNKQTIAMEVLWRPAWAFGFGSRDSFLLR